MRLGVAHNNFSFDNEVYNIQQNQEYIIERDLEESDFPTPVSACRISVQNAINNQHSQHNITVYHVCIQGLLVINSLVWSSNKTLPHRPLR